MKKVLEYVPIITVCLMYFGFCNLHYYYKEFKIDIYNYISNTEILISFLPTLVLLTSLSYVFVYSKVVNHQGLKESEKKNENEQVLEKDENTVTTIKEKKLVWRILISLPFQMLFLIIVQKITDFILVHYFGFKSYQFQELNLFFASVFLMILYFSSSLFTNQKVIGENILLVTLFSVIYIGIQISTYRKLDADKIKDGQCIKNIEFEYNGKKISTSKQNVYIGQTQSYLFLYNTKNKSTSIYKTEDVEIITVK